MNSRPESDRPEPTVLVERRGSTVVISINRPQVRNAVDGPTAAALASAFRAFEDDDDLMVAVLTGVPGPDGRAGFCAGADLRAISDGRGNRIEADGDGPMGPTRMMLGKPVIAAVEGHAVAGGLELAVWCDLRVAASTAVFGVFCRRWGVPLVDGGTVRLPRLIGQSHALDMILTGRPVDADEAARMGLVNRVVEPGAAVEAAVELAESIAAFPESCMRSDRRSTYEQWELPPGSAMANETTLGLDVIRSGETLAGATRFAQGAGRGGSFND